MERCLHSQEKGYFYSDTTIKMSLVITLLVFLSAISEVTNADEKRVKVIPQEYTRVAARYSVPASILYAVALAESGYTKAGIYNPWPWTLNIEGRAKRFEQADEALTSLLRSIRAGKHVDIGIMQVNSRWHHHRVNSLGELLNPYINLTKGAEILKEQRKRSKSWWEAVGRYHAPGNDAKSLRRAARYRNRVKVIYDTYIGRMT